jgi:5-methylcytosine-specific restriction enzyme A
VILYACTCSEGSHPKGTRCPEKERERDRRRGTRTQRGLDNDWLRLVAQAIKRQPWCSYCGATEDLTGDHRIPRSKGGVARTVDDVIVACRSCNSSRGSGDVPRSIAVPDASPSLPVIA